MIVSSLSCGSQRRPIGRPIERAERVLSFGALTFAPLESSRSSEERNANEQASACEPNNQLAESACGRRADGQAGPQWAPQAARRASARESRSRRAHLAAANSSESRVAPPRLAEFNFQFGFPLGAGSSCAHEQEADSGRRPPAADSGLWALDRRSAGHDSRGFLVVCRACPAGRQAGWLARLFCPATRSARGAQGRRRQCKVGER